MQYDYKNYLLTTDSELASNLSDKIKLSICAQDVQNHIQTKKPYVSIILLDACRVLENSSSNHLISPQVTNINTTWKTINTNYTSN